MSEPTATATPQGRLVCVGIGMMLGAHMTPRAAGELERAEVVFAALADPLMEAWLQRQHSDVRSLQRHYAPGKPRSATYRDMVAEILAAVRAGRRVCVAFYGHPGVFAVVGHRAIAEARAEGHAASMQPGISAADCLYADLGMDPGLPGCVHLEATRLLLFEHRLDPALWLVLWQVGVAGDASLARRDSPRALRECLLERLLRDYPREHEVILYQAATLAIHAPRIERLPLAGLLDAELTLATTLVLPPCRAPKPDAAMRAALAARAVTLDGVMPIGDAGASTRLQDLP
jgi:uncharacterized protein YabN with tetrapyrrole methylase and pyrophosphatase domain